MRELAPNAEDREFLRRDGNAARRRLFALVGRISYGRCPRAKPSCRPGEARRTCNCFLLTPSDQLAGVGEVGELYIRSPHLAAGYVDDDALTAANFLVNPFTGEKSRSAVSHRRARPIFAGWQRRMGRPNRSARQHPRLSRRARRSGSDAAPMPRRARRRRGRRVNFSSDDGGREHGYAAGRVLGK